MAASTLGQQLVGTFFQACESARCLFGSPSKKQEQEESTDLHALLEKENHSVTMNDLSSDMVRDIFSFLPLEEMWEKRSVGKFFLTFCNTDSRWIPIIPPDFIKNEVMTLAKHGKMLRWLYLVKYKKWLQQWHHNKDHDALLAGSRSKFYDGYFSLAPWRHFQNYTSYPQPWLHRMVHCQPCPTTMVAQEPPSKRRRLARLRGSNNNHRSTANAQAFSKSPHPTWKKWKHKAGDSSFFQCRLRSKEIFDLDSDYDFTSDIYTTPILENCDVSLQRKVLKVVLQPVNFRIHKDGKKHDRLPDHDMEMLHRWNKECATILECYFGRGTATVAPLLYHSTKLFFGRSGTLRKEKEGLVEPGTDKRVIQVQSETLQGLGATVLENLGMYTSAQDDQETLILYIVAPHVSFWE